MNYQLIDSGSGLKLEKFGSYILIRPCPQAIWNKKSPELWKSAHAQYSKEVGWKGEIPSNWTAEIGGVLFKIAPTPQGQVGVFPEHASLWEDLRPLSAGANVLNLFAYTGGATIALAQAGAKVCHVDGAKGSVDWARENAALNGLSNAPIRWIVDDVMKFMLREVKRKATYDGILLDPPSFGRGTKGEIFKLEKDLLPLLELSNTLLSTNPCFVLLSCHTTGIEPSDLKKLVLSVFHGAKCKAGEISLSSIPSGSFVKITYV